MQISHNWLFLAITSLHLTTDNFFSELQVYMYIFQRIARKKSGNYHLFYHCGKKLPYCIAILGFKLWYRCKILHSFLQYSILIGHCVVKIFWMTAKLYIWPLTPLLLLFTLRTLIVSFLSLKLSILSSDQYFISNYLFSKAAKQ